MRELTGEEREASLTQRARSERSGRGQEKGMEGLGTAFEGLWRA